MNVFLKLHLLLNCGKNKLKIKYSNKNQWLLASVLKSPDSRTQFIMGKLLIYQGLKTILISLSIALEIILQDLNFDKKIISFI